MTRAEMITLLRACAESNILGDVLEEVANKIEADGHGLDDQARRAHRLQGDLDEAHAANQALADDLKAERDETRSLEDAADALRTHLVTIGLPAAPVSRPPGSLGALCAALGVCE